MNSVRPLFTKYCATLTKISDSDFVCGVDMKCCYSNIMRIGLVRILVCEVLNAAICPETSKIILFFLVQMIYNRFKSFEWIPHHWLPFRAPLHTSWVHVQQLFHFLAEHGIVNFPSSQVVFQRHPKLGRASNLEETKSLNVIFDFKY